MSAAPAGGAADAPGGRLECRPRARGELDALHVFGASSGWDEIDTIPFKGAGALAIGNRILVVTTNPKYLEGVSPLRADHPGRDAVVVYERAH